MVALKVPRKWAISWAKTAIPIYRRPDTVKYGNLRTENVLSTLIFQKSMHKFIVRIYFSTGIVDNRLYEEDFTQVLTFWTIIMPFLSANLFIGPLIIVLAQNTDFSTKLPRIDWWGAPSAINLIHFLLLLSVAYIFEKLLLKEA